MSNTGHARISPLGYVPVDALEQRPGVVVGVSRWELGPVNTSELLLLLVGPGEGQDVCQVAAAVHDAIVGKKPEEARVDTLHCLRRQ